MFSKLYHKVFSGFELFQLRNLHLIIYNKKFLKLYGKNHVLKFAFTLLILTGLIDVLSTILNYRLRTPGTMAMTILNYLLLCLFAWVYRKNVINRNDPSVGYVLIKDLNNKPIVYLHRRYLTIYEFINGLNLFSFFVRWILLFSVLLSRPWYVNVLTVIDIYIYNVLMWIVPIFLYIENDHDSYAKVTKERIIEIRNGLKSKPALGPIGV